ncbi:MFS family permease [Pullulanibacillus pueri]|uniref:MFS transporter n=1 Tax=Pullulanibacillus pueri TaxID=1437324 RepID=A0A8J2ZTR8_9BACL|nr:MFS transporter [Pullulanibacillus pueri]MBM7680734.1 MFS family permease [Pullulanibacillus pueri]GGH78130.1 MFS transporter [Pullulanibacillus pueri]
MRYSKTFGIGLGFFALSLVWAIYNTFMPLILGDFIESNGIRGAIMGLDNLIAVILIPIIGTWSDRITTRYGQRLPFLAVGMPIAALSFILLPFGTVSLARLLAIDVIFLIAMTIYRAPVISLMPDHTHPEHRSSANGIINFMGAIGSILALFVIGKLFDLNPHFPFIISGIILLFSFFLLFFIIDRKPAFASKATDHQEAMGFSSLFKSYTLLGKPEHQGALYIFIAIFFYFIGYSGVESQFSIYATEYLHITGGEASLTLGFFSLSLVVSAIPAGFIGSKFGKVRTMLTGLILLAVLFLLLIPFQSLLVIRITLLIAGFAWSLVSVPAYPLAADLGGLTKIGFFTGLYYFFSMASAVIGPPLLGFIMDLFGYPALFIAAPISLVIALYFLTFGNKKLKLARKTSPT